MEKTAVTKTELMSLLHQYTPWEMLHLKNLEYVQAIEGLNQSLEHPLTDADKIYGLHLPQNLKPPFDTLTENQYFRDDEICIVQHDRYTPPRRHNHEFYELQYVYEGEFPQEIEGTRFLMHTGDLTILPPGVYHALDVQNYSIVLNILVTRQRFEGIVMGNLKEANVLSNDLMSKVYAENVNNYIIFHTNGDPDTQNVILNMCLEQLNKTAFHQYFMNSYLHLLIGHLLRGFSDSCDLPAVKKKRYSQNFAILRYIDLHFKDITLSSLAAEFHYSPQHMSKLVKMITGNSLSNYVLTKRMEMAADLLTASNMKIREIGETSGYPNQENFVRSFKKYYGTTPSQYRKDHKKSQDST